MERLLAAGYGNGTVRQFDINSVSAAGKGSPGLMHVGLNACQCYPAHSSEVSACAYARVPDCDDKFLLISGSVTGELSIHRGGVENTGMLKLKSDAETGSAKLLSPHAGHPMYPFKLRRLMAQCFCVRAEMDA